MIELAGDRVTADDQLKKARERVEAEQKVVKFCEAEAKQLEKEYEVRFCSLLSRTVLTIPLVVGKASVQLL